MKIPAIATVSVQGILVVLVMCFCTWQGVALIGIIAISTLIGAAMIASNVPSASVGVRLCLSGASWVCAVIAAIILCPRYIGSNSAEAFTASVVAWTTAVSLVPAALSSNQHARGTNWKWQVIFWWCFGVGVLAANAWLLNRTIVFYTCLLLICSLLIACKLWFRPPNGLILVQNTAILLVLGLPLADFFVRPPIHTQINGEPNSPHYYSLKSVAHPGRVYRCWWPLILNEWEHMRNRITVVDPKVKSPRYRFRPGAKSRMYHSDIVINNFGFRGRDITFDKGNTFRIVAIGESTTFGFTLNPDDRPWPELLQEMIRTRVGFDHPVEVINAGFPASTIEDSLGRLKQDILPLKPDMIISYHGINGFDLLETAIPPVNDVPPHYEERPLRLVANLEYRWKVYQFNKRRSSKLEQHPPTFRDVLGSKYAMATRRLVEICKTNNIDLVVGTFSLAVNGSSENEVVDFYHGIYPDLPWTIKANEAYTTMLKALAKKEPTIHLVDTHPGLDGDFLKFTDLMHLKQEGRQKIADAFFPAVEELLQTKTNRRLRSSDGDLR